MHVVLVNPRAQKAHRRLPLSVLFVARNLGPEHTWEIVDANIDGDAARRAEEAVAGDPANTVVLVTVMPGPQLRWAVPFCRALKSRFPNVPIVWGGYFATVYSESVAKDPAVDVVCIGQGEVTAKELVDAFAAGRDPVTVAGTAVWRDGRLVKAPPRGYAKGSSYADPPYERLPMERYAATTFLGRRTYNHHTSYGCPYFCNFCAVVNMYEGRWLPDPAEHVVRIVRHLHDRYGADAIEFHDNNFFAWEKRTYDFARGIEGLGVRWWGEGRIDTMLGWASETWEAMARSGLAMVFYGAESGDDEALAAMDKGGLTVNDTLELNRRAKGYGVVPEFSFVLGNPKDPEGDIERSLALVRRLKNENPACEIILYLYTPVPLPGQYDEARKQGFAFPETLDEWLSPRWYRYEDRRNPGTPWLTPGMVRRVYDFEAVLHARYPTVSDRNLRRWQRTVLRVLSTARYRSGLTQRPLEIQALQRLWSYRRPEEMGF
jgi:anaerobic magnesium-protoporphyrin IX monomethyl ester cyclase